MLFKLPTSTTYTNNLLFLTALFSMLLVGCAELPSEKVTESDQDSCQRLKKIIDAYSSRFSGLKQGAPSSNPWNNANVWKAESLFAGTDCQIWGWAKGLSNYSCQWKESGQDAAIAAYDKYTPKIQSCLGDNWKASEPKAKTGKQTLFKSQSTDAVVSIRYFQDTRAPFSNPWFTSMVIGDLIQTVEQ